LGEDFFFIFPLFSLCSFQVPNGFPICFLKFLMCSPRVFPIAPCFNPICFAQSPPLENLYRWAKGGGGTPSFNRIFYFGGASIVSIFVFCNGPIKRTHCKKKKSWTFEAPPTNEYQSHSSPAHHPTHPAPQKQIINEFCAKMPKLFYSTHRVHSRKAKGEVKDVWTNWI